MTLAFRLNRAVDGAPADFASYRIGTARTPVEILAHMGDLMDWALRQADGVPDWTEAPPQDWDAELARFRAALLQLDEPLASGPLLCEEKRLLQGPIADALTHAGQIALLRGLQGSPVRPKNYFKAEI